MTKLNEISKKSLYSYIGKANKDAGHQEKKSMHSGYGVETKAKAMKRRNKRVAGMMKAMRKIHENKESLTETSYEQHLNPNKPIVITGVMGMKSKRFKKRFKNMIAFEKWSDSPEAEDYDIQYVTNEEKLDELSKNTLKSYLHKAKRDRDKSEVDQAANLHSVFRDYDPKEPLKKKVEKDKALNRRIHNRYKGMDAAKYRLAMKEENLDELSKKTLRSYIDKTNKEIPQRRDSFSTNKAKDTEEFSKRYKKYSNRILGQDVAKMKLSRTEELISELSRKTLKSYLNKRQRKQNKLWDKNVYRHTWSKKDAHDFDKNERNMQRATQKLSGTDVYGNKPKVKASNEEKSFRVRNLETIDDVLMHYDHDIKGNTITMTDENYKKFMSELKKKKISI